MYLLPRAFTHARQILVRSPWTHRSGIVGGKFSGCDGFDIGVVGGDDHCRCIGDWWNVLGLKLGLGLGIGV